jgi:tetratricopeptide (TPR) repeat protein
MLQLGALLSEGPDSGDYAEAASLLSGVLAFAQRHQFVDFHDVIVVARDGLSRVAGELGRLGEQETIQRAVKRGGAKALIALGKASPEGVADAVELALIGAGPSPSTFDLLVCGEYSILGGKAEAGAELIQQAVALGGRNHFYFKSLGWALLSAGRHEEAAAAFTQALAGQEEWPPGTPAEADPDHWTAAYFLDRVNEQQYTDRWRKDARNGEKFACFPWFYVGQRREIEGKTTEAAAAYRKSVELGRLPDAHYASNWAAYRLKMLVGDQAASAPAP